MRVDNLIRNARELPAFGYSLIVASQLPEDINTDLAGNCSNHFFGVLNSENHLDFLLENRWMRTI